MCPEVDLLKEIPIFKLLDPSEAQGLAAKLTVVNFKAGEPVFFTGDPGDAMYVICEGEAEVFFKNDTGEKIVLERPGKGDFFGELSFLEQGCRSASVAAATDLKAFRLSHADLREFLESRPHAAMHMLAAIAKRLRFTAEQLRHTATRNVNEEEADGRNWIQRGADAIAAFSGSISFIVLHAIIFTFWIVVNTVHVPGIPQFDPYPFGFLTLAVSLEAIFLATLVLFSQNRQAAKDKIRADIEYDVNLKAELEVAHLHEKIDRLNSEALARFEAIQQQLAKISPAGR
jgi:Predicted membrane protein